MPEYSYWIIFGLILIIGEFVVSGLVLIFLVTRQSSRVAKRHVRKDKPRHPDVFNNVQRSPHNDRRYA